MTVRLGSLRWRDLAVVLLVLLAASAAAFAVTRLLFAAQARSVLAVHFASIPATAGQALAIWLHNARSTVGVAVFAVCRPVSRRLNGGEPLRAERALGRCCDAIVAVWAVGYATAGGVLLGAYGTRQLDAFLPEGPVEIAAWVLLVVLYLDVRRGRLTLRQTAVRLAAIVVMLGVAALLEARAAL